MRLTSVSALLLAAATIGGVASCSQPGKSTASKPGAPQIEIKSEAYNFDMMSARQTYMTRNDSTTYYITMEANIQYPQKVGNYNLKNLQDTLGYFINSQPASSIADAITTFVTSPEKTGVGREYRAIDSVPASADPTTVFFSNVDLKVLEITPDMLTFNLNFETFLGAAHPMHGSSPFTYLLNQARVVDNQWLFLPGSEDAITAQIRDAIMRETGLSDEELRQMMLVSYLPIPETVYIEDGNIVFHYNPYAILPYYLGDIDAQVSPYLLADQLTPAAKALLIEE